MGGFGMNLEQMDSGALIFSDDNIQIYGVE
jgi:hypothetical protein